MQVEKTRKPTILVVEDESIVATDLERSLRRLGYSVLEPAASVDEALKTAREGEPDLVLMDVRIQGDRDGIETAELLRRLFGLPVVYLTAYGDAATLERAKRTEPMGYLMKPVKPGDLKSTVEMALFRHGVETRLREREQWLRTVLDSIFDSVVATDNSGNVRLINRKAASLLGREADSCVGEAISTLVRMRSVDDQTELATLLPKALETRVPQERREDVLLVCHDGHRKAVSESASPILDGERLLGGLTVLRDVTERLALRQQIEFNDRLAAMGRMAAGVAHEVNNPLMAVAANLHFAVEALKGKQDEGEVSADRGEMLDALSDAQFNTQRIRDIVSDLGSFSRRSGTEPQRANIAKVVQWAVHSAAPSLEQRAIVRVDVPANLEVALPETRLGQVLVNLLTNAAQAMSSNGFPQQNVIRIRAHVDNGYVRIELSDTGPGIPDNLIGSVFDPFVTTKGNNGGTGLGLFVCHGIVTSAGGRIEVESAPGHGTRFHIHLPSGIPHEST